MKGVDIVIEKQRLIFNDHLWTGNDCSWFGNCMPDERPEGTFPSVLISGSDYRDVLLDDTKDVISFFDVAPERTENRCSVDIYFAVNLSKLYPSITESQTEYALADSVEWVKKGGMFTIEKIVDGYESWKGWSMCKREDNMHPFYLFKITTNVNYVLTC